MGLLLLGCANQDRVLFYDELFLERWQFMSRRAKRRNRVYKGILDNPYSDILSNVPSIFLDAFSGRNDLQSQILEQFGNTTWEVTS